MGGVGNSTLLHRNRVFENPKAYNNNRRFSAPKLSLQRKFNYGAIDWDPMWSTP